LREGRLNGKARSGAGRTGRRRLKGLPGGQVSQAMASLAEKEGKITAGTYEWKARTKAFPRYLPAPGHDPPCLGGKSLGSRPSEPQPRSASPATSALPLLWTPGGQIAQALSRGPEGRLPALPARAAVLGEQTPWPSPPGSPQLLQPRGQALSRVAPAPRAGTPTPRLRGLTASARSGAGLTTPGQTPSRG
jgi:hypothetical protein